jgi:hypothetical protein
VHGEVGRQASPQARAESSLVAKVGSVVCPKEAAIKENLNPQTDKRIVICSAIRTSCAQVIESCHIMDTDLNRASPRPIKRYKPVQGLISLFTKTGTRRRNPKHVSLVITPPNAAPSPRRSYAEFCAPGWTTKASMVVVQAMGNEEVVPTGLEDKAKAKLIRGRGIIIHISDLATQASMLAVVGEEYMSCEVVALAVIIQTSEWVSVISVNKWHLIGRLGPMCRAMAYCMATCMVEQVTRLSRWKR